MEIEPRPAFWVPLVGIVVAGLAIGRIFGPGWGGAILIVGGLVVTALTIEGDERFLRRALTTPGG